MDLKNKVQNNQINIKPFSVVRKKHNMITFT